MNYLQLTIIPLIVALIVQTTKFIIFSIKHGVNWPYFFTHGHMPSSHSAIVTSLVTIIGIVEGVDTGSFAISFVLAILIIDDALRIRMHLGDQGRYLNMLIQTLKFDKKKFPRLKERLGHRSSEVAVGIVYGFVLTILLHKLFTLFF